MRTTSICAITLLTLTGGLFAHRAASFSASGDMFTTQFTGEITDSFCTLEGHHSGAIKTKNTSKAGCVVACVKLEGAEFVLYNPETKRIYKLDDQLQPEAFAGQKVIVAGTYDSQTGTIRVAKIRPVIESGL